MRPVDVLFSKRYRSDDPWFIQAAITSSYIGILPIHLIDANSHRKTILKFLKIWNSIIRQRDLKYVYRHSWVTLNKTTGIDSCWMHTKCRNHGISPTHSDRPDFIFVPNKQFDSILKKLKYQEALGIYDIGNNGL